MLFGRPSRNKPNRHAPRRFRLEALEVRNCPSASALGLGVMAQTAGYPDVQVSGSVYGVSGPMSGVQVTLSGPVNAALAVNSSGQFSYLGAASGLGTITATATDSAGDSAQTSSTIMDEPPNVNNLQAMITGQGQQVDISGSVSADNSADLTVNLSGSAGLKTTSVTTDANGNFNLLTTATSLGTVTAVVTDDWGVQSSPISTQLMDSGPQIEGLTVTATGQGKQVDVSGSVSAVSPSGLTVTFSGSAGVSGSATTDSSGNFNLVTTASQLGNVSAVTTDIWGVSSSQATTTLMVPPPNIMSLTATDMGNGYWQIQGTVSGPDVTDDTVQLSGPVSSSATPNSSGSFSVIVQMSGNPSGTEDAIATDVWGQTSNEATYTFSN